MKNINDMDEALSIDGGKKGPPVSAAEALRRAASQLLTNPALQKDNLGELYARAYAQEALHGMMEIARDMTIDAKVRHQAYFDVYTIAYGKPASVVKSNNDVGSNTVIDGEIAKASLAGQTLNLLAEYASVPPEDWPDELKKAAGLL